MGSSGSGKTTVGRAVAERLGLPRVELDALFWEPDWTPAEDRVFRARLRKATSGDKWVVDGNYFSRGALDIVWPRVDMIVFLDLPKRTVVRRVVVRTTRRTLMRTELWSGNRETIRNALVGDEPLIPYLWCHYEKYRARYLEFAADPTWAHVEWVRLRSPRAVRAWVGSL
jgi:adenylate kinase family enzyme